MTYDEFLERARSVQILDKSLDRQLRALYVDQGTLTQLVRAILDWRRDMTEGLATMPMLTEEGVRRCVGQQGQVAGVDAVLTLIHALMEKKEATNGEQQQTV